MSRRWIAGWSGRGAFRSIPLKCLCYAVSQNKEFCKVRGLEMPGFLWTDARWSK